MSIFSKDQTKKVVVNAENHGYKPETVTFKQGKPAQLKFIPSDNMGCMKLFFTLSTEENHEEKHFTFIGVGSHPFHVRTGWMRKRRQH